MLETEVIIKTKLQFVKLQLTDKTERNPPKVTTLPLDGTANDLSR
jgi:hypothetical protein